VFRQNTAAFIHDLPAGTLSNVDSDSNYVRIQVLTNAGALDRGKQLAMVEQLTRITAEAAGDPTVASRTWVLLTEAPEGGWASTAAPTPMRGWWPPPGHRSPVCRPASPQPTSIATRTADRLGFGRDPAAGVCTSRTPAHHRLVVAFLPGD
jgi:phenylpyruvate tautomerase PptA (4-oxalocrotonate tautomerase family)